MSTRARFPPGLALFTGAYIAAAGLAALLTGNGEFIFYIVVMAVLISVITIVHRRSHLSSGLLWALSVWGLLHMAGGLVPLPAGWFHHGPNSVLYSLWLIPDRLKYDQVVHAYGFAITTWLCWEALQAGVRARFGHSLQPTVGIVVLCAAAGMGFGAFNEIVEFIATLTLPHTNVGGYENTGWDLVFNALGSAAAAVVLYRRGSSRDSPPAAD